MHSNATPISLLERLRQPKDADWERFVQLYTPLLYVWAKRLGLQEQDSLDLIQDVLAQLVRKLPEFNYDSTRSFRGWLRTVLVNKWREHRRRLSLKIEADKSLSGIGKDDDAHEFEEEDYRRHLIAKALDILKIEFPESTWKAFQEYVLAERSPAEVAAELNISTGTVYAAKSRVMTRLRQELDGLLD